MPAAIAVLLTYRPNLPDTYRTRTRTLNPPHPLHTGFLSPANRGSLVIAVLVLYVMMGSVAGYGSARLYKTFKGKEWQKCTMYVPYVSVAGCVLCVSVRAWKGDGSAC